MTISRVKSADQRQLEIMTRVAYDLQGLRIASGLRLCANFREKLKQQTETAIAEMPDESGVAPIELKTAQDSGELSEDAEKLLDKLRKSYRRLTDGVARNRKLPKENGFKGDGLIAEYGELVLVDTYMSLEREERAMFTQIEWQLEKLPIWNEFLLGVRGIGPAVASVFITYFDPYKAERPSQFWAYAGLDVGPDGRARSRRKEHLIEREYTTSKGEKGVKMSTTYSPWVQARLIGAVGPSLLRAASPYRKHYDNYKHRIETDPARIKLEAKDWAKHIEEGHDPKTLWTKQRIHKAAIRYMLKMLLLDFWRAYRTIEGLPICDDYNTARRGYAHHGELPREAAE